MTAQARLREWLEERVGDVGAVDLQRIAGGQSNPTYLVSTEVGGRYVLRRKPIGKLLPKAHMIEREYQAMAALARSEVPTPEMIDISDDTDIVGAPFFVMKHVEGRIFMDPRLQDLSNADRAALFDDMNRVVASLHRVDPDSVGLAGFGRAEGFLERQIRLWTSQYRAAETKHIAAIEHLIGWLPANLPGRSDRAIFHGDLRLDNMIVHPTEPRVLALIDWELATLGDPLADLAYNALAWHMPPDLFRGLLGADMEGIPDEAAYLAAYCRRTGRPDLPHWRFYLAFAAFRLAAIVQGIAKRAQDGTANDAGAAELGARSAPIAELGWDIAARHAGPLP